ncbi:glycosyltransferase family 4 protein [Candidatus Giovannonibacteria bacterium]|nr:glycosyltransferase family 4 protein [Candidatus Giovannonibacteria bacterium]
MQKIPNKRAVLKRPKLRIAQVAPITERVPPKNYGGTERVVYALTEELVRKGHEVTLFASGDSITSAKLVSVYPRALREAKLTTLFETGELTLLNIGLAYNNQNEFDIIHDHNSHISLPTANLASKPALITLHGPFTTYVKKLFSALNRPKLAAISYSQYNSAPNLNYAGIVHNGLLMESYPFAARHDGYLLWVGRISMEKGTHLAIEVAQYLNMPLIIAAKLDEADLKYFQEYVGPKLSDNLIKWVGEVSEEERNRLMMRAKCLLNPIIWREPFGLTMIEAQACGCPVIAFANGSAPELIVNGKTGFLVSDVDGMIDAVGKVDRISRSECRRHALENFSAQKMADKYEKIYYQMLKLRNGT